MPRRWRSPERKHTPNPGVSPPTDTPGTCTQGPGWAPGWDLLDEDQLQNGHSDAEWLGKKVNVKGKLLLLGRDWESLSPAMPLDV